MSATSTTVPLELINIDEQILPISTIQASKPPRCVVGFPVFLWVGDLRERPFDYPSNPPSHLNRKIWCCLGFLTFGVVGICHELPERGQKRTRFTRSGRHAERNVAMLGCSMRLWINRWPQIAANTRASVLQSLTFRIRFRFK